MLKKILITSAALLSISTSYADENYNSCAIEIAVATPPIGYNEKVAFNVTSDRGTNQSVTIRGGDAARTIGHLICAGDPFKVTATFYSTPSYQLLDKLGIINQPVGQCSLKAGSIMLNGPFNIASIVFPQDFVCN